MMHLLTGAASAAARLLKLIMPPVVYPDIEMRLRRVTEGVELFGHAGLPDGTILRYSVQAHGLAKIVRSGRSGTVRVKDQAYAVLFSPPPWKATRLDVIVSIRADRHQPPETQRLLGSRGQRMAADVGGDWGAEYFLTSTLDIE